MSNQDEFENNELLAQNIGIHGQVGQLAQTQAAQQYYVEEKEKSIAEAQLEVDETLGKIYHLLKQDVWKEIESGVFDWVDIKDEKKRTLTDEGVERIMQTIRLYINKENLLSNFSEEQINNIMLSFRNALNANFYMKYEIIFRTPSFEECKEILETRISEKVKIKSYVREILGESHDEEEIKKEMMKEIELRIENEIKRIRKEQIKYNLKEWEMMFEGLSQIVFATLNRAWRGEERGSLRRHTTISEVLGQTKNLTPENKGGWKLWGR